MKKNVLITGGTGFVGKHLTDLLLQNGYSVSILSRRKKAIQTQLLHLGCRNKL
jgi:uncharacterized protein YbjT (DUF2867 family)